MKLSFVIPTFNCAAWLPHAIKSVREQKYKDIELIIVNDGSTDSTKEYLEWLLKHKEGLDIGVIHLQNVGRCMARNIGNKAAQGDVLCVLDADDYAHPNRAEKTVEKIKNGAEFVYGSAEVMDFSGTKLGVLNADVFNLRKAIEKGTNEIVHSSVAYTKSLAMRYPYLIDKEISDLGLDDWEHQLRIASHGVKMDFILAPIVAYRLLHSAISSTRDENKVREVKKKHIEKLMVTA